MIGPQLQQDVLSTFTRIAQDLLVAETAFALKLADPEILGTFPTVSFANR